MLIHSYNHIPVCTLIYSHINIRSHKVHNRSDLVNTMRHRYREHLLRRPA